MKEVILLAVLAYAAIIDIKKMIVPTRVYIALFALSLLDFGFSSLIGMATCFIPFFVIGIMRPHAIGGGDVKLAAMIGLCLGNKAVFALFIAAIIAVAVMPILQTLTKQRQKPFALVPFFAVGVFIVIFFI